MSNRNISESLDQLLSNNKDWAQRMIAKDPEFFKKLVAQQSPEFHNSVLTLCPRF